MLHDDQYDKVKLAHNLSCIAWFIERHAKQNAQKANDTECYELLVDLKDNLDSYIDRLREMLKK